MKSTTTQKQIGKNLNDGTWPNDWNEEVTSKGINEVNFYQPPALCFCKFYQHFKNTQNRHQLYAYLSS